MTVIDSEARLCMEFNYTDRTVVQNFRDLLDNRLNSKNVHKILNEDEDSDEDDGDDNDIDAFSNSSSVKWYQKEIWQLSKLPYYEDLEKQANKTLADIKTGLAHSIILNDPVTGLMHWVPELERYIDYYGRRISKEDHILFVRLLNCLVKKGNTFRDVKIAMHCLNKLI
ncbi:unnamed protein product, partial [Strongylus vulgaris]